MSLQVYTEKDWIKRMYRKSESIRTESVAKTSLKMFLENLQNRFIITCFSLAL